MFFNIFIFLFFFEISVKTLRVIGRLAFFLQLLFVNFEFILKLLFLVFQLFLLVFSADIQFLLQRFSAVIVDVQDSRVAH